MKKKINKKKKQTKYLVIGIIIVILLGGVAIYLYQTKASTPEAIDSNDTNGTNDNDETDDTTNESTTDEVADETSKRDIDETQTEEEQKENQLEEENNEYSYTTQEGEEVTVEAIKSVSATGFAGSSNYKFYLKGTTLYFLDVSSSDNEEIILAYNVKDLYLENKEVVAELYSDGEIVTENNYITYK